MKNNGFKYLVIYSQITASKLNILLKIWNYDTYNLKIIIDIVYWNIYHDFFGIKFNVTQLKYFSLETTKFTLKLGKTLKSKIYPPSEKYKSLIKQLK